MRLWTALKRTFWFWMETETHVYAFSVAANVLLSFFPFLICILALARVILGAKVAIAALDLALLDYFPEALAKSLRQALVPLTGTAPTFTSICVLLFTANGVFEPLEVALNRINGITANRSFLKNQLISFGLIFACGGLILLSTVLTALNQQYLLQALGNNPVATFLTAAFFKFAAIPITALTLFLIYQFLPNGPVSSGRTIPAAIVVGLLLEVLKYLNLATWPYLRVKFSREYGPFVYSAAIVMWSFLAAMLILAGAEWAARRQQMVDESPAPEGAELTAGPSPLPMAPGAPDQA
jgi:uncharacterized BrkB/YihY/UPF0761 family membrane protein